MENNTQTFRDKEIAREDARDKFLVIADHTNFAGVYAYQFESTPEERKEQNLSQPYSKVAFKLICYGEGKKKMFMQHCDLDDYYLFTDKVLKFKGPLAVDQKIPVYEFLGFSEKKGEFRKLKVDASPKKTDPKKSVFMFSFERGPAAKSGEKGYTVTDSSKIEKDFIVLEEDQLKKIALTTREHFSSLRTAVLTLHYKSLYGNK